MLIFGVFHVGDTISAEEQAVITGVWLSRPIWAERPIKDVEHDDSSAGRHGSLGIPLGIVTEVELC